MFEEQDYIGENVSISGKPTSVWIGTEPDAKFLNVDFLNKEYDVAIIGGGIVGLTTAYYLVNEGKNVLILDMRSIVKDVTGHTTAKITSLHGLIYDYLIRHVGLEKAKLYAAAQEEAKDFITQISKKEGIECDLRKAKAFTYSLTTKGADEISREIEAVKRLELPLCEDPDFSLPFETKGLICFDNQAQFHPRKYLMGLAKKLNTKSCDIVEGIRVTGVKEEAGFVEIQTGRGSIKAKKAVIASHYPIFDSGAFFTKLIPRRSYVYVARLDGYVPEGMYYCIDEPRYSFRPVDFGKDKWFMFGGQGHKAGQANEKERYKALESFGKENFDIKKIEYHWSTQDNYTTDRIPFIGLSPKTKNIYLATGFGGWGMTNGTIAGKVISDLILGNDNQYVSLFDPSRSKPVSAVSKFIKNNLDVAKKFFAGRRLGSDRFAMPTELKPGGGSIIEYGEEKVAAHREISGKTITLSSKCTHLGCTVKWNNAEKTWDCPCHGSRYSATGEVIHGPAVRDLERKNKH